MELNPNPKPKDKQKILKPDSRSIAWMVGSNLGKSKMVNMVLKTKAEIVTFRYSGLNLVIFPWYSLRQKGKVSLAKTPNHMPTSLRINSI